MDSEAGIKMIRDMKELPCDRNENICTINLEDKT